MPIQHYQNAEQEIPFAPATHVAPILDDETQQATNAQTSFVELQNVTHDGSQRYEITWAGLLSTVKRSDVFTVALVSLVMTGLWAAVAALLGKPFFLLPVLLGSTLFMTIVTLKVAHQATFTGQRPLSWIISWLFRATLWFATFAILDVMRHKNVDVPYEICAASVFATSSIVWQYWQQSRRNRKAS